MGSVGHAQARCHMAATCCVCLQVTSEVVKQQLVRHRRSLFGAVGQGASGGRRRPQLATWQSRGLVLL